MKSKTIKFVTAAICTVFISSSFVGCTDKETTSPNADGNTDSSSAGNTAGTTETVTYPIKDGGKLTYWTPLDPKVSKTAKNLGETEFAKQLSKETGIQIEWIHPTQGQEMQSLNLLIASGDLPDVVDALWGAWYLGGPEKAIQDNVILKTNDLMAKYAPNYLNILKSDPEKDKEVRTDGGDLYGFSCFRGDDLNTVYTGPLLRGDWLKELNLELPTTVDEYENVLKAFKDKKGATAPFTITKKNPPEVIDRFFVSGAYGFSTTWYIDDNKKVAYGPLAPKFKDYLNRLNKWYQEGLIDKNFPTNDGNAVKANMLNGKSGASIGFLGGDMGTWMNSMKDKDSKYEIVAAPYPSLNKGEKVKYVQKDWKFNAFTTAITASCKNPELATMFLDYGYSEKGDMLYNFGIEGVSYKMVSGYPTYTDTVMKNQNSLSIAEAMAQYQRSPYANGPFVQRKEYIEQYYILPQQKDALKLLAQADPYPNQYPPASATTEESQELATIEGDINTYVSEMTLKFILGTEPLSNFDSFISKLKTMKVDRAIELRQAAVDRYNKR